MPKKSKLKIKLPVKSKTRKVWSINPKTRIHDDAGYRRSTQKENVRKELDKGMTEEAEDA